MCGLGCILCVEPSEGNRGMVRAGENSRFKVVNYRKKCVDCGEGKAVYTRIVLLNSAVHCKGFH